MLQGSPDGCKHRFSTEHGQNVHMFTRRLNAVSQGLISFAARQKLLVAAMAFCVIGYFYWPRYGLLETVNAKTTKLDYEYSNFSTKRNAYATPLDIEDAVIASIGQRNTLSYCQITNCKSISCSYIAGDLDPGVVASEFIETDFKATCKNTGSVMLSFSKCKFPGNALQKNWLQTSLSIVELKLDSCSLREIEDDVFSLPIYDETKTILLVNNKLSTLRKAMFRHLDALETLTIQGNILKQVEENLLEHVSSSLAILELSQAIDDPGVLRNVTGGGADLKVQILSLRGNNITTISRELFEGVPAVQSLYLQDSKVKTVSKGTLEPMASSILQLIITDNSITSLPEGLFDPVLHSNRRFSMAIENNPWRCDCSLKWLQDLVQTRPSIVISMPVCKTPEINAGKSFAMADFCPSNSVVTSTVTTTTKKSTNDNWVRPTTSQWSDTTEGGVRVACSTARTFLRIGGSRKLMSTDLNLSPRSPYFYVSKILDEGILMSLPDSNEGVTLLWFDNDDVERSLSCAKNVKYSYLVQNIDPQATYTMCLLSDNRTTVSPLNCLAVTTNPTYQSRTWLKNKHMSIVFSLLGVSCFLSFLAGAFVSFVQIRRHPSLLRGNKRVMLVKHRNVDAIVLPKGVNVEEEKQGRGVATCLDNKPHEDGYITPLPPAPLPARRVTGVSRLNSMQSDWNSYVSELDSMETQLVPWSLNRLNSEQEKRKSEAPPLPPHPFIGVPSVSLAVDSWEEHFVDETPNV